jgi:hypothetical protein
MTNDNNNMIDLNGIADQNERINNENSKDQIEDETNSEGEVSQDEDNVNGYQESNAQAMQQDNNSSLS